MELQHETERHLIKMRMQAENEYEIEVAEWRSKIKDPEELHHILGLMKIKHTKKLLESDKKIIEILDQKVKTCRQSLTILSFVCLILKFKLYYKLAKNSNFNHDQISRKMRQVSDHKVHAVKNYIFLIIHLWDTIIRSQAQ